MGCISSSPAAAPQDHALVTPEQQHADLHKYLVEQVASRAKPKVAAVPGAFELVVQHPNLRRADQLRMCTCNVQTFAPLLEPLLPSAQLLSVSCNPIAFVYTFRIACRTYAAPHSWSPPSRATSQGRRPTRSNPPQRRRPTSYQRTFVTMDVGHCRPTGVRCCNGGLSSESSDDDEYPLGFVIN